MLAEDASWRFRIAGQNDLGPIVGRASTLDFARKSMAAETDQRRHKLLNVTVHSAEATTALAHVYLMLTANTGGKPGMIATGFYAFQLKRTGDERRIAELFLGTDNPW